MRSRRKSRLHISNMQPADSGNYSCLAENVNGYIKKTVEIYVIPQQHTTPIQVTTMAPVTIGYAITKISSYIRDLALVSPDENGQGKPASCNSILAFVTVCMDTAIL
ncbi:hypothetical protein ACTXT7_002065 [Hymenolepis weldensis]